jgi:hypothetical protein
MVARNEMAPRFAFQMTPPVGSGVSIPTASFASNPRASKSRDPRGPAVSSSGTHSDPAGFKKAFITRRSGSVNHCDQPAFHVGRAATEQVYALDPRLKLVAALRRNYIIMTTEIERSRANPGRREYTRTFASHLSEADSVQFVGQNASTLFVLIPWWIL